MLYHSRTVPVLTNWHIQKCYINPWNLMGADPFYPNKGQCGAEYPTVNSKFA